MGYELGFSCMGASADVKGGRRHLERNSSVNRVTAGSSDVGDFETGLVVLG